MKYFRHLTTGLEGDRLKPIYANFGFHKGYALYFMLLELCAKKYNGKQEIFRFLESELRKSLQLSKKSLETLLKLLKNYELVSDYVFTENNRVIELSIPDLIEISDDYSRKVRTNSGQKSVKGSPKNKKKNNNKNNSSKGTQTAFEHPTNLQDFKILFSDKIYESWLRLFNDQANWIEQELLNAYEYFYVRKTKPPSASFSGWEKRMSSWLSRGWENASRNQQAQQQPKGRPVDGYTGSAS